MIPVIEDKIKLRTKREVLRLFLYTKLTERGIRFSDTELDVLMELHEVGGYYTIEQEGIFFDNCIQKKFRTSPQSVRNVLTRFVMNGIVRKPKIHQRYISTELLPTIDSDVVGLMFLVHNAS